MKESLIPFVGRKNVGDLNRRDFMKATAAACATAAVNENVDAAATTTADLVHLSLWDASELLQQGQASPVELANACLARIERLNPQLNAFITVMRDQALGDRKSGGE